jgi:hypothetical protein
MKRGTTGAGGSLIIGSNPVEVRLGSMRQGRRRFDHLPAAATRPDLAATNDRSR